MTEQIESEASEQPLGQMTKGMEGRTSAQARRSRRPARTSVIRRRWVPRAVAVAARQEWRKIAQDHLICLCHRKGRGPVPESGGREGICPGDQGAEPPAKPIAVAFHEVAVPTPDSSHRQPAVLGLDYTGTGNLPPAAARSGRYRHADRRHPPGAHPNDIDVVIGMRGPIAPPEMCNGLMIPIVAFDQIYIRARHPHQGDSQAGKRRGKTIRPGSRRAIPAPSQMTE